MCVFVHIGVGFGVACSGDRQFQGLEMRNSNSAVPLFLYIYLRMIPKIIHYCWFGRKALPQDVQNYIQTWKQHMPDWEIYEWNEDNFDIATAPTYAQQAYQVGKYAFVSDYVRLWALERLGGVYFDTDVEVLKPFDDLLDNIAFVGLEESLAHLPGTCVMGCEAHCLWVKDMLSN